MALKSKSLESGVKKVNKGAKTGRSSSKSVKERKTSGTASSAPKKRTGGLGWLIVVLVLGLVGGSGYLAYPQIAEKFLSLPLLGNAESRLAGFSERISALETQAGEDGSRDKIIQRLEIERTKLTSDLNQALARLKAVEKSIAAVQKVAEAATRVDEATRARQSLKLLSDRLTALEENRNGDAETAAQLVQIKSNELKARVEKLEKNQVDPSSSREVLAGVQQRLNRIEKRAFVSPASDGQAAVLLAVGQLREVASRGGAYQRELNAVEAIAGTDKELLAVLSPLVGQAKVGVPSLTVLSREFEVLAGAIINQARNKAIKGWFGQVIAKLSMLVTIRRTDGGEEGSLENMVAHAESILADGDLMAAVDTVKGIIVLSPDAASLAETWLDRAETRLSIERALGALHIYVVSKLGGRVKG